MTKVENGVKHKPVTSLGHQEGRRVFWEWPKFFKLCPTPFSRRGELFCRGRSPPSSPGYGPGQTVQ